MSISSGRTDTQKPINVLDGKFMPAATGKQITLVVDAPHVIAQGAWVAASISKPLEDFLYSKPSTLMTGDHTGGRRPVFANDWLTEHLDNKLLRVVVCSMHTLSIGKR